MKLPAEAHPDGRAGLITPQEYADRALLGVGLSEAEIKVSTLLFAEP
ncbi:hypothetical protein [Pseudofrankia asymbiotica]|nr:hypothetical protein [Pseudofrankia asymbiotica]